MDRWKYKGNFKTKAVKNIMENNDESPFKKTQLKNGVKGDEWYKSTIVKKIKNNE